MTPRDGASESQVRAAQPNVSTWLSANAGSGKTRVLTDRVARLLLNEVQPQHILCLTYTKAAASEMQNRLFKRLGEWAMLPDHALRDALRELGQVGDITADRLRKARTLFARAIEAPGGLKIQTIHSFCSSLLRRFPLEARVAPQFSEMEDRAAALLRADIVDEMADGPNAKIVADVARHHTGENFELLTAEMVRNRGLFQKDHSFEDILSLFDLSADCTEDSISNTVFLSGETDILNRLVPALADSGPQDQKAGQKLQQVASLGWAALPDLEAVFLTGAGAKSPFSAKLGSFPTKSLQAKLAGLMPELDNWMARVESAREARLALSAARKTYILHCFARRFLPAFEAAKQQRGWLDFDDLILKARQLLNDPDVAQWVLYRLDGGIDHILVDEAQDTSPAQWGVIKKLAQEITSAQGIEENPRTLFVVGDKKQSIYSFQGADPREFDRMHLEFKSHLAAHGQHLQDSTLEYSFRSSDAVLRLVDQTFTTKEAAGFVKESQHRAYKADLPGRVDLWPVVEKADDPDDRNWFDPVDQRSARHHTVILANQIARNIRQLIDTGETIPIDGPQQGSLQKRPVRAGDFLILVQRRSDLFHEIIRACKSENLPIAGSDRLKVGAEIAVKDLAALLGFLATPEDNLSLATVLRSPLCSWSEQELFDLSHRRAAPYLWQALRDQSEKYPETLKMLRDLRDQIDFLRPFDLIERILTRHNGRQNLLDRLGHEAEDGINALLSQALSYERSTIPSLTGFLIWMQTDDLDIKRQTDNSGNRIRVMTVHGAKGLESPIVILPDTGKRDIRMSEEVITSENAAFWRTSANETPAVIQAAKERHKNSQLSERLRLLYVAMTRAEKWLIVAAAGELGKDGNSWYHIVQQAMVPAGALPHDFEGGQGLRLTFGDWSALESVSTQENVTDPPIVDDYLLQAAPDYPAPEITLSPSDLGGAKALAGEAGLAEGVALLRGQQVHLLLEHLANESPSNWAARASQLLPQNDEAPSEHQVQEILQEVRRVLTKPELASLFDPTSLAEVSVSAKLGQHRLHGTVDRLIIEPDRVLVVDFKTNQVVPKLAHETPEGLLRQMGAYAHGLKQVFPNKKIETAILWTSTATLMYLPHDLVMGSLKNTQYLDDPTSDT